MEKVLLSLLLIIMSYACFAQPVPLGPITIGEKVSIYSKILQEERAYTVKLPSSYDFHQFTSSIPAHFPVLYVLDGDEYFKIVSATADYLSNGQNGNYMMPEHIVVAISNTDRMRDLTPTSTQHAVDGTELPAPIGGGADKFLDFIEQELIPEIEDSYRTMPYRTIAGHSIGGLLALYAPIAKPELFNAVISIDPSLWWNDQSLLNKAERYFEIDTDQVLSVFLASVNHSENDEVPEDPSLSLASQLSQILKTVASPGIRSRWKYYENEDHGSVPLISFYDGLQYVFAGHKEIYENVFEQQASMTLGYRELSMRLGETFNPPEILMVNTAQDVIEFSEQRPLLGLTMLQEAVSLYPDSVYSHTNLGLAYMRTGNNEAARNEFETVLEIDPENEMAKSQLQALGEE